MSGGSRCAAFGTGGCSSGRLWRLAPPARRPRRAATSTSSPRSSRPTLLRDLRARDDRLCPRERLADERRRDPWHEPAGTPRAGRVARMHPRRQRCRHPAAPARAPRDACRHRPVALAGNDGVPCDQDAEEGSTQSALGGGRPDAPDEVHDADPLGCDRDPRDAVAAGRRPQADARAHDANRDPGERLPRRFLATRRTTEDRPLWSSLGSAVRSGRCRGRREA